MKRPGFIRFAHLDIDAYSRILLFLSFLIDSTSNWQEILSTVGSTGLMFPINCEVFFWNSQTLEPVSKFVRLQTIETITDDLEAKKELARCTGRKEQET